MEKFKVGQTVWYYNAPCRPKLVTVEAVYDLYYTIKLSDRNLTSAIPDELFSYPDERYELTERLRNDSFDLDRYASDIENEKGEN